MKTTLSHLDAYRVPHPIGGNSPKGATWGAFQIPHVDQWLRSQFGAFYNVLASDGEAHYGSPGTEWDHVSVHVRKDGKNGQRISSTPTWEDMEHIRSLFFDDDETVMQLSVPRADHISHHDHVLHLWKPLKAAIPVPPKILV